MKYALGFPQALVVNWKTLWIYSDPAMKELGVQGLAILINIRSLCYKNYFIFHIHKPITLTLPKSNIWAADILTRRKRPEETKGAPGN